MKKKRITLLVALCFMLMFGQESKAQTAIERLKTEYPAVMEQYGKKLQDLKIHYIFVIDVSGTMDKYKDSVVVPGISKFLGNLPEGDYASIIAFGGRAEEMCTPLKINAENRKLLVAKLYESYSRASRLDPRRTLLNMAATKVLDAVERDTVSDICFAVFFSDLCDESGEWDYKERVSKLKDRAFGVVATALTADNDAQKQRGIRRMENTFPGFAYSSNVEDVFGDKLENYKYNIYIPELKKVIGTELKKAFDGLQLSAKLAIDRKVKLVANINKKTPSFIRGLSVDTAYLTDQSSEISEMRFVASPRIPRHKKSCNMGHVVFSDKGPLFHNDPYVSMAMIYQLNTPETKSDKEPNFVRDLEKLEMSDALYSETEIEAKASWVIGWPFWLFCIAAVAAFVYGLLLIINTILPRKMAGKKLAVSNATTGNTQYYSIPDKRKFTIGKQGCNCVIHGALFELKAECRNGSPLNLLWKRRLLLRLDPKNGGGIEMSQGARKNLRRVCIRKGKEATIVQNISARYTLSITKR